jgi:hypothetical protein
MAWLHLTTAQSVKLAAARPSSLGTLPDYFTDSGQPTLPGGPKLRILPQIRVKRRDFA